MKDKLPTLAAVAHWLRERVGEVHELRLLQGGAWSSAFAYRCAQGERVVKFGEFGSDYAKDAAVAQWRPAGVPIAPVLERGSALGCAFATMEFVRGEAFDQLPAERFARAFEHLLEVLGRLHAAEPPGAGFGLWDADGETLLPRGPHTQWADFLFSMSRRDDARLAGWREALARNERANRLYASAQRELDRGAARCASPRRLLHGDLLNRNLLVDGTDKVVALLDWGCSLLGDPLYEYADLLYAAAWYPTLDVTRIRRAALAVGGPDAPHRLWCYQLAVALGAMQYQAFANLASDLAGSVEVVERLLDEGDGQRRPGSATRD